MKGAVIFIKSIYWMETEKDNRNCWAEMFNGQKGLNRTSAKTGPLRRSVFKKKREVRSQLLSIRHSTIQCGTINWIVYNMPNRRYPWREKCELNFIRFAVWKAYENHRRKFFGDNFTESIPFLLYLSHVRVIDSSLKHLRI